MSATLPSAAPTLPPPAPAAPPARPAPTRAALVLNFAIVYVVWGSTYLAMRVAVRTVPPFLLGAIRFLIAGLLLAAWVTWRERPAWPPARAWRWAVATGALLFLGGNAGVAWAGRTVPSGVVALLAASLALWIVLIDWLRPGGRRPSVPTFAGLALGLAGVGLLVGPAELAGSGGVDPWGSAFVLGGSLAWATGSMLTRHPAAPASPVLGSAMQMLAGGALLCVAAALHGDFSARTAAAMSPDASGAGTALAAVVYLITFGSLVGFTAYIWLMRNASPAKVATYAYVNPVVAVLLGWLLGGEGLGARTLAASAVIVAAVALITVGRTRAA